MVSPESAISSDYMDIARLYFSLSRQGAPKSQDAKDKLLAHIKEKGARASLPIAPMRRLALARGAPPRPAPIHSLAACRRDGAILQHRLRAAGVGD